VNALAGGGTLLTFPTLLWAGFDARVANATSTVALWPGSLGGVWGYRHEIADTRATLRLLVLPSAIGGAAGAALVLITPTSTFERLVPYLILFATVLFVLQEPVQRRLDALGGHKVVAIVLQLATSIYGGYFGAGMGILLLTVLGLLGVSDIHRANGLKNLLGMCINGVALIGFAVSGLVSWAEALLMAAAAVVGGYGGARLAKRLGRRIVRRIVVVIGFAIGIAMLFRTA